MSCSNCGAAVSPGSKICAACGTPQKAQKPSGGFCGSCGTPLIQKYSPCPNCGHVKTTFYTPPNPGNPNPGNPNPGNPNPGNPNPGNPNPGNPIPPPNPQYQHLYKNEGTALILSIILGFLGLCGIGQVYAGQVKRGVIMIIVGIILVIVGLLTMGIGLIAYLAYFIWGIFDTQKVCRQYNAFVTQNGRPPW